MNSKLPHLHHSIAGGALQAQLGLNLGNFTTKTSSAMVTASDVCMRLLGRYVAVHTSYKLAKFQLLPEVLDDCGATHRNISLSQRVTLVLLRYLRFVAVVPSIFVTKITQSIWFEKNCLRHWFVGSLMILNPPCMDVTILGLVQVNSWPSHTQNHCCFFEFTPTQIKTDELGSSLITFIG